MCPQYTLSMQPIDDVCYLWYEPIKHSTSASLMYDACDSCFRNKKKKKICKQAFLPLMDVYSMIDITQFMIPVLVWHVMINLIIPIMSSSFIAFVHSWRYLSLIFSSPAGVMLCSTNGVTLVLSILKSSTIFLLESIKLNRSFSTNLSFLASRFSSSEGL